MKIPKIRKLKRFLPKKVQTKRGGYLAMALLIVFSIFVYDIYFRSPKVKAATVGSSSIATATSAGYQSGNYSNRKMVVTSTGTMVAFFNTGTQSVGGYAYATSTDNGTTWSSATLIDSTTNNAGDISVAIDGNNNIYVVYNLNILSSSGGVRFRLMTYNNGTWTIGSAVSVANNNGAPLADTEANPAIAVLSDGTLVEANTSSNLSVIATRYSTNSGATWSAGTSLNFNVNINSNMISVGNSEWMVIDGGLYADNQKNGSFVKMATVVSNNTTSFSITYGLNQIYLLYNDASGIEEATYNTSTGLLSSANNLSASTNDVVGSIISDSQNVWAVWQSYVAANSYNVVYKTYNGATWSGATSITTDNLNNNSINAPGRVVSSANVPIIWTVGTASPYTIKSATFSTTGTVTDTGNQTGSYSGSLTGSSGDTIVKCGTWFYNTVNIVAGMTVKVCSSNGQTGGSLTIYANSVTVAGTIDGAGRGSPGGIGVYGVGGAGGTGGPMNSAGNAGSAGSSNSGGKGSGSFGGGGGGGGTNSAGGASAGTAPTTLGSGSGGGGGGAGIGSTNTAGSAGSLAGYLGSGTNNDTSTDESIVFGGGGGGGGSGGSGAGGGGGGGGADSPSPALAFAGGDGGNGAAGGRGGKGGNGGALVRIYSAGNLTVSGNIDVTGQTAGSSGSGAAGSAGGPGQQGCVNGLC